MRRFITFIFALLLCISLAVPSFALVQMDEDIDKKEAPEIAATEGGFAAIVYDADGNVLLEIPFSDLLVTALAQADTSEEISDEAAEILKNAHQKFLNPDAMLSIQASVMNEVAIDELGKHHTADSFYVFNMFDLTMKNQEVLELLKQEGTYVEVCFDLGEDASSVIASMVYANKAWFNVELTHDGDGIIKCQFKLFGTVVFLIEGGAGGEGDDGQVTDPDGDEDFVPSIGYKPIPDIVPGEGGIVNPDGTVDPVEPDCFAFISVDETEKAEGSLSEQERILRSVYNVMKNPNIKLSMVAPRMNDVAIELLGAGHDADDFVVRDLFYMDLICGEHAGILPAEGLQLKLVFDLGVEPDDIITGMVFVEGEWLPLEATNNGDDTVTFLFDQICPVAFLVPKDQQNNVSAGVFLSSFYAGNNNQTPVNNIAVEAAGMDAGIWMLTGSVSLIAVVLLLVVYIHGKKRENA